MPSKLDLDTKFHHQALNLRTQRQQLLASNIANADTPHYKARDIDFGSALKGAMRGQAGAALPMAVTAAGHQTTLLDVAPTHLFYRGELQANVDGNTVDMDVERAQFADNAVRYEASLNFLNRKFRGLLDAVQSPNR